MININELAQQIKLEGYSEENAEANLSSSNKNWVGVDNVVVLDTVIDFIRGFE